MKKVFPVKTQPYMKAGMKKQIGTLQATLKGTWMPNLQRAIFKIEGNYLVLSPEYN